MDFAVKISNVSIFLIGLIETFKNISKSFMSDRYNILLVKGVPLGPLIDYHSGVYEIVFPKLISSATVMSNFTRIQPAV